MLGHKKITLNVKAGLLLWRHECFAGVRGYRDSEEIMGSAFRDRKHVLLKRSSRVHRLYFHYKMSAPVKKVSAHTMTEFHKGDVTQASDHLPVFVDVRL